MPIRLIMRLIAALALAALLTVPALGRVGHAAGPQETLEGTLIVSHSDDFAHSMARWYYDLHTTDGRVVPLHFSDNGPEWAGGAKVRVHGTPAAGGIDAGTSTSNVAILSSPPSTNVATGPKKVAVILFNFQNNTQQPFTADTVRSTVFTGTNSVNAYYKAVSYGGLSLTGALRTDGDVLGWYTIPVSVGSTCDYTAWQQDANAAAQTAGVNLSLYDNLIYAFPNVSACPWAGLAYVPGNVSFNNGYLNRVSIYGHELGHNFGAHHASSYRCTSSGVSVAISSSCTANEYGDPFDIMGTGNTHEMNAFHRGQDGFLHSSNTQDVTTSGTYSLAPIEPTSSGVQTLRIPWGMDSSGMTRYYYLEYKQPDAQYDNYTATDPVVNGVTIHLATAYNASPVQSWLIDTTPSTATFSDAALAAGQTFTDSAKGISITTVSVSSSGASVRISFGSSPPPPTASAPGAPVIGSASAGNGAATVSWSPPASNGGAAISSYTISAYVGSSIAPSTTQTVQPGTACAVNPCSASIGGLTNGVSYSFTVKATNSAGTGPESNHSNAVTPVAPPTGPTVPGAPAIGSALAGNAMATVSWSPPASNGGSAITGYTVTSYLGSTGTVAGTQSFTTAACTTSGCSAVIGSLANGTTYTFTVKAANSLGPGPESGRSNSVTPVGVTATVPSAPLSVSAVRLAAGTAVVSWQPPTSSGGSAIAYYTITPYLSLTTTVWGTPIIASPTACSSGTCSATFAGLRSGMYYTFTVKATNGIGTSAESTRSGLVYL